MLLCTRFVGVWCFIWSSETCQIKIEHEALWGQVLGKAGFSALFFPVHQFYQRLHSITVLLLFFSLRLCLCVLFLEGLQADVFVCMFLCCVFVFSLFRACSLSLVFLLYQRKKLQSFFIHDSSSGRLCAGVTACIWQLV